MRPRCDKPRWGEHPSIHYSRPEVQHVPSQITSGDAKCARYPMILSLVWYRVSFREALQRNNTGSACLGRGCIRPVTGFASDDNTCHPTTDATQGLSLSVPNISRGAVMVATLSLRRCRRLLFFDSLTLLKERVRSLDLPRRCSWVRGPLPIREVICST